MSLFDGKPIGRIDFGPRYRPQEPAQELTPAERIDAWNASQAAQRRSDGIWRAVRATAEGTNISTPTEDA